MKKFSLIIAALATAASAQASIVINLYADKLSNNADLAIPAGSLLQLVNLGVDGVFSRIDLTDGSVASSTQWVSGDDSLLSGAFTGSGVASGSASAFAMPDASGLLNATFEFATGVVPSGTKIGLRWFSNLQASNFASTILGTTNLYGEYTLQSSPVYGGDPWVAPSDGGASGFDSFVTVAGGGTIPNTVGRASISPVPEPTSVFLIAAGAAGLMMRRRRQS